MSVLRKANRTYCREVAQCEYTQQTGLATSTVTDDDELSVIVCAVSLLLWQYDETATELQLA